MYNYDHMNKMHNIICSYERLVLVCLPSRNADPQKDKNSLNVTVESINVSGDAFLQSFIFYFSCY